MAPVSGRLLLTGGLLLLAVPLLIVGFVVVGITTDNEAELAMVLLFLGALLAGIAGLACLVVGAVWRAAGAGARARAHDAALVADMGRVATPLQAAAVQARGTSRAWIRFAPLIAVAVLLVVLNLPIPDTAKAVSLVTLFGGVVAFFLLPRRRGSAAAAEDWTPPGPPGGRPPHPTGEVVPDAVASWVSGLSQRAQATRLWQWHRETLLAREELMAGVALRHGGEFRRVDPAMRAGRQIVVNVIRGARDGIPFTAFDDVATTETSTDDRITKVSIRPTTTVVAFFAAPFRLAVVPDRLDATVRWGHIGHQVQLESGAFNDTYNVYCVDQVRARLVLNPAVMESLLGTPGLQLVLDKGLLRIDRPGGFASESTLDAMVDLVVRVHRSASAAQVRPR